MGSSPELWGDRGVQASTAHSNRAWDEFVVKAPGGHHVQTTAWSRFKASQGWQVVRFTVGDSPHITAGGQILTRRVPGFGCVGYLDHGPLAPADAESVDMAVSAVKDVARRYRMRLLILQPPEDNPLLETRLAESGFGDNHVKLALGATVLVDLTRPEDEILAAMKPKTRYNVRKAQRSPLTVRLGGAADLPVVQAMLADTGRRRGFAVPSLATFEQMRCHLEPEGSFEMLIAEHGGEPVSAILTVPFADRVIFKRGAWTGQHGELHPNERLHWEAIKRAKERGFRRYDFDGVERAAAEAVVTGRRLPAEMVESVTRFKLGFGEAALLPVSRTYLPGGPLRWAHDTIYPRLAHRRAVRRTVRRLQV